MLSMASVKSSGGASGYFAKDNYYSPAGAQGSSGWAGTGADELGLHDEVDAEAFKAVLEGRLPDGTVLRPGPDGKRGFGSDFTFSAPKSLSLLAYIGGDKRLLALNRSAVEKTMAWAEKNLAATRMEVDGEMRVVKTGNLVMAMFEHDTSRAQEPDAHIHVVIANATKGPDGKWRTLANRPLWKANTLLGSIHNAYLREGAAELGYSPEIAGKYGSFEIGNIARSVIMAFSSRRQQIVEGLKSSLHTTRAATDAVTLHTREEKAAIADRGALHDEWRAKAEGLGIDLPGIVAGTHVPGAAPVRPWEKAAEGLRSIVDQARAVAAYFARVVGGAEKDPLIPERIGALPVAERASAQAVASAIRHLAEREAAFETFDIYKAALNFALPVTIEGVEARVAVLRDRGVLVQGKGRSESFMTTEQAIRTERQIVSEIGSGRGASDALMALEAAGTALQEQSHAIAGFALNGGQEAAGRLVLASTDRIVAIQGVAGAGKTTALQPLQAVLADHGKEMLGLAFQNKMVDDLARAGIPSRTIASFIGRHQRLLETGTPQAWIDRARDEYKDTYIVVDESSMTSNGDQLKLNRLANLLQLPRMVTMGDERQLGAIDAGKPFEVMQRLGIDMATMPDNLRARGDVVKTVAAALQNRDPAAAMKALEPFTITAPETIAETAVEQWMGLAPEVRERTGLYASGRVHKAAINEQVQEARLAAGEISDTALGITVLDRVSMTGEEMRYARSYAPGMVAEFERRIREQGIQPGKYDVMSTDTKTNSVMVKAPDGKLKTYMPDRIQPSKEDRTARLYTLKNLKLHAEDRIRWGDNDRDRGLLNASQARVVSWDRHGVTIETDTKMVHTLAHGDPMLAKIDLSYALNAHMAQGVTSDYGIAVMDSRETHLANLRLALVTATRVRDGITVVTDDPARLTRGLGTNLGDKTSALEIIGEVPARGESAQTAAGAARNEASNEWDRAAAKAFEDKPGLATGTPAATTTGSDAAKTGSAKPELEKKIDDGSSRNRQIEFDL